MNDIRFLETNILLYAYDEDAPSKRAVALRLVEQGWSEMGQTATRVQVLREMHCNLERLGVSRAEAAQIVRDYAPWPIVDNSLGFLFAALDDRARWRLSVWDALILSAARASGATEVLTEDFSHGQDYGGIRAINPFL